MEDPQHVIICIHGLHGNTRDFDKFVEHLRLKFAENTIIHVSNSNQRFKTHDGLEVMGNRLVSEIQSVFSGVQTKPKLSVIGHSLGGLIARYAIKVLDESNFFEERAEAMTFITIASPHLGSRRPPSWAPVNFAVNKYCYFGIGQTGKELLLEDGDAKTGKRPLLAEMCDHELGFIRALRKFKHHLLAANIRNDFQVPFCSAAVLPSNPYDLNKKPAQNFQIVGHFNFSPELVQMLESVAPVTIRPEVHFLVNKESIESGKLASGSLIREESPIELAHDTSVASSVSADEEEEEESHSLRTPLKIDIQNDGEEEEEAVECVREPESALPEFIMSPHHRRGTAAMRSVDTPDAKSSRRIKIQTHAVSAELQKDSVGILLDCLPDGCAFKSSSRLGPSSPQFVVDNFSEMEHSVSMARLLQTAVKWRHIHAEINATFAHTAILEKVPLRFIPGLPKSPLGKPFGNFVAEMLFHDHCLSL